ncbi:MAG: hypothetical protein EOQ82_32370 [Mesorhizobium sp.]|uniref:hypothetical protein n=1 Tax=Mesorhizobium sp. TaxID=1871066 RepID=UPI000FE9232C|nr:hypothetical protein [Mesorhizobium sp.]RWH49465.1 MAG: hypothetical protein EOQ82_32370 [Mesorhizobium sp.]
MKREPFVATIKITQAPQPVEKEFELDLTKLAWHGDGPLGKAGLDPVSRDLLEVARVVWEVEKHTPKRISSQRTRSVSVSMAIRAPGSWSAAAVQALRDTLRLLGNAEWHFNFEKRRAGAMNSLDLMAAASRADGGEIDSVALFSGGLDSTSGLAWLQMEKRDVALASFYGAKAKQVAIRDNFAIERHFQAMCQWAGSRTRFGGQFQYRSLLFLSLGAAVAASYGAKILYQFENGPLAASLPPSPNYRMTRHAHPKLHHLVGELFAELHGRPLRVSNPFLGLTKRQAAELLEKAVSSKKALTEILSKTETCWNLNSRSVVGAITKSIGQACGLCIPCLVRRTAIGRQDPVSHRVDFRNPKDQWFADPAARIHVDAYLVWSRKVLSPEYTVDDFAYEMPRVVEEAIHASAGALSPSSALELYRRFAQEIADTFPVPKRSAVGDD